MTQSPKAKDILEQISKPNTKLGDLRNLAKEIKKDHELAMELWSDGHFMARQLAILIMDRKMLSAELVDSLIADIEKHPEAEKLQLADWLMANQLTKDRKTLEMIESWKDSTEDLKRRIYWYYQGRLRWMGKTPPGSQDLLAEIDRTIEKEVPEVQWAMNFTAGWIGVYEKDFREECIALGERTGLYKGKMVSKGCTPEYLPEFIAIETEKRKL